VAREGQVSSDRLRSLSLARAQASDQRPCAIVGVMLRLEQAGLVSRERIEADQRRSWSRSSRKAARSCSGSCRSSTSAMQSWNRRSAHIDARGLRRTRSLLSRTPSPEESSGGPSRQKPQRDEDRQRRCSESNDGLNVAWLPTGCFSRRCRPIDGYSSGRPRAHHLISPLLTFAPMSRATPRPAAGYAVLIAVISSPEVEALPSSVSNRLRYAWV